jgi:putative endonuclease
MGPQNRDTPGEWVVYLLECSDSTYYCGCCKADRLAQRIDQHNRGTGSRYTRGRCPVTLRLHTRLLSKPEAYRIEYRTKQLSRKKKPEFLRQFAPDRYR